jgi:predicted metal-dependent hydrolase
VLVDRRDVVQLAAAARARAVVDYVVEHEVCHLEVMDHSPRFWALLESRVPDWRAHSRWLRRYGSTLVL